MFDANMRHLPKGHKFFAKMWGVSDKIKSMGVNVDDLVICHMLNDGNDNPCVDMMINKGLFTISSDKDFYDNWFVYEGNLDGTGFICEKSKSKAMKMLTSN